MQVFPFLLCISGVWSTYWISGEQYKPSKYLVAQLCSKIFNKFQILFSVIREREQKELQGAAPLNN